MRNGRRPRLLVIDDDASVREILCECLVLLGYEVDSAADGRSGVTLVGQGGYDLVLTDLAMPGMTGWEVVEAVWQRTPGVDVVMITGSATEQDVARAREAGLTLVHKPVSFDQLKAVVQERLGRRDPER